MIKFIKNATQAEKTWVGQTIFAGEYYQIQDHEDLVWANNSVLMVAVATGEAVVAKSDDGTTDITDVAEAIGYLKNVSEAPRTEDKREIVAINRIPPGYTVYPTGVADAIVQYGQGQGTQLRLNSVTGSVDFQLLNHWYAIGGRIIWEGSSLDDHTNAVLVAPPSTGFTSVSGGGDFNMVAIGPSMNIFVPAAPGTGFVSGDLSAKFTGTPVLKATPVPSIGNQGYFDYNSDTNVITPNYLCLS